MRYEVGSMRYEMGIGNMGLGYGTDMRSEVRPLTGFPTRFNRKGRKALAKDARPDESVRTGKVCTTPLRTFRCTLRTLRGTLRPLR